MREKVTLTRFRLGAPDQLAAQHPLNGSRSALVLLEDRDRQQQRLIVHVQLQHGRSRASRSSSVRCGEAEGGFAPLIVQVSWKPSRKVPRGASVLRPLPRGAAHPQVPVGGRQQGLQAQVGVGRGLHQAPLVHSGTGAVDGVGGQHGGGRRRLPDRRRRGRRWRRRTRRPAPRSTPITALSCRGSACTPWETALHRPPLMGSMPGSRAARRKVSGLGLPGRLSCAATLPLTMNSKRLQVAVASTALLRRERRRRWPGVPRCGQRIEEGDRARIGSDALFRSAAAARG